MKNESVVNWGEPSNTQICAAPQDHLHIATVMTQCNFLHGKVLTIIDASFINPQQNKAVKDLIRKAFREQMDYMAKLSDPKSEDRQQMTPPVEIGTVMTPTYSIAGRIETK